MLKILIVDDEKLSRIKIKSHLSSHYIVEAASYEEAVTKLSQSFDLCFLDLNLDNGMELLGFEVLKIAVSKGIYSVVMSSLHDDEIIEHAYEIGCNDYYSKGNEQTSIPICLLGESGTGKTFLAKEIHEQSKRTGGFVAVNCAALSEELLESELFGHAKGAYTGAHSEVKGKLALANNGTLFLDEIGSMSLTMQTKLLKAIEEKTFKRKERGYTRSHQKRN